MPCELIESQVYAPVRDTADTLTLSLLTGLQPLQHNPYTEPLWRAAVAQYERGMAPAEHRIASKLRNKFHQLEAQPHQVSE